jgi:hypothetical protein
MTVMRFGNIPAATSDDSRVNLQQLSGFAPRQPTPVSEPVPGGNHNPGRSFDFFVTTLTRLHSKDDGFDWGLNCMDVSDARETVAHLTHWR